MDQPNFPPYPFLQRDMLSFEKGTAFSLSVTIMTQTTDSVNVRGLTREGAFTYAINPAGSEAAEDFTLRLPDIPIAISVTRDASTTDQGNCFVVVRLQINGDTSVILCQGHPASNLGLSWPVQQNPHPLQDIGNLYNSNGTNPAAGAEFSVSAPAGEWWKLNGVIATFTASATVANRRPALRFSYGGAATYALSPLAADITANQVVTCSWFKGATCFADTTGLVQTAPLVDDFILSPNGFLASLTKNIQVGDTWTNIKYIVQNYQLV